MSELPTKDDKRFEKIMKDVMDPGANSQDPISQILTVLKKAQDLEAIKLSFSEDPMKAEQYSAVYKRRISSIPPAILKRTRDTEELVGGVIFPLRAKQISLYGHPRPNRFDIGTVINVQPHLYESMNEEGIEKVKKEIIPKLRELLMNCGSNENVKDRNKCTFSQYLHMIVEDMLLYGWFSTEVRDNQIGKFHSFRAADAGTIYFATDLKSHQKQLDNIRQEAKVILERLNQNPDSKYIDVDRFTNGDYTWVQVIEDRPYQVFTDEQLIVWSLNPSTDIMRAGYPVSPIERMLSSIVTHINLSTHNKMFFLNGRAARNVMVFQSENMDADDIQAIRAQMTAHINSANAAWRMPVFGIGSQDKITIQPLDAAGRDMEFQYLADLNKRMIMAAFQLSPDEIAALSYLSKGTNSQSLAECLHYDTKILTPKGLFKVGDIAKEGVSELPVWTGEKFVQARLFQTSVKRLVETVLETGTAIKTSPDHYFRTVDSSGELGWTPQALLKPGDRVLTSRTPVEGLTEVPRYNGKPLTVDMMEVLGWATGDGSFVGARPRAGAYLKLFYNNNKERDIWSRHEQILKDFGLSPKKKEKVLSVEERDAIAARYGFKDVAEIRISTYLYDTAFFNWLMSIGFSTSSDGKSIPAIFYTLPVEYRTAFLRGLFSADEHVSKTVNGQVTLTCSDPALKDQVRMMLAGLGIRTIKYEGKTKEVFVGSKRATVPATNKLSIKDKRAFFSLIGFLQEHKQPRKEWLSGEDQRFLPKPLENKLINTLLSSDISSVDRGTLTASFNKGSKVSVKRLRRLCGSVNLTLPEWVDSYHFDAVSEVIDRNEEVVMYDLSLSDDVHAFSANGIIVHNSNNEWKLIKGQESGLRPILQSIEAFLNERLLPRINPEWAKLVRISLEGLDADSPEKEATRLQQDSAIFLTMNDILDRVEKEHVDIGGEFPLNAAYMATIEKYYTMGEILETFDPIKCKGYGDAKMRPDLAFYMNNPAWFQFLQLQQQAQQMQMQQQQMAMQQQQGVNPQMDGQGGPPSNGEQSAPMTPPHEGQQRGQPGQPDQPEQSDLDSAMSQIGESLSKAEHDLPINRKEMLKLHKLIRKKQSEAFERDSKQMFQEIMGVLEGKKPSHGHEHD